MVVNKVMGGEVTKYLHELFYRVNFINYLINLSIAALATSPQAHKQRRTSVTNAAGLCPGNKGGINVSKYPRKIFYSVNFVQYFINLLLHHF
jgi:hypothetical protein